MNSCQTATKYNNRMNNITVRLVHIFKRNSVYEVSSVLANKVRSWRARILRL